MVRLGFGVAGWFWRNACGGAGLAGCNSPSLEDSVLTYSSSQVAEGGRGELSQLVRCGNCDKMVIASAVVRMGISSIEMAAVLWR